jgi:hypothetical protein
MSFAAIISQSVRCYSLSTVSYVLLYIRDSGAPGTVLAIPAMSVEENEVKELDLRILFFNAENTLDRGAFSAHPGRIFFADPHLPDRGCLHSPSGCPDPPLCRHRNSLPSRNLRQVSSAFVRIGIIACLEEGCNRFSHISVLEILVSPGFLFFGKDPRCFEAGNWPVMCKNPL